MDMHISFASVYNLLKFHRKGLVEKTRRKERVSQNDHIKKEKEEECHIFMKRYCNNNISTLFELTDKPRISGKQQ